MEDLKKNMEIIGNIIANFFHLFLKHPVIHVITKNAFIVYWVNYYLLTNILLFVHCSISDTYCLS